MTDNRKQIEYRRKKYNNNQNKNSSKKQLNAKSYENKSVRNNKGDLRTKKQESKSIFRKILEALSSIFAVIVILASLFTLVFRVIFKVEVVKIFGYSGLIILTGSMEPAYHPGDFIFIKEQKSYDIGDVITFHEKGMIVTHRIVAKDGKKYTTKGDANNSNDPAIEFSAIEGKVVGHVHKVGNVMLFLQTPAGIISILVVLISLEAFFAAKRKMVERWEKDIHLF